MKLAKLYLKAYGMFDGQVLDFDAKPAGLQIVYGANEAGKSTTLRAIKSLLFGIDERTPDKFRHDYAALRVGGVVVRGDGTRLSFMRRKGRKATLFGLDESTGAEQTTRPLDDALVGALLGGLSEGTFSTMFGLDQEQLERGGQDILKGQGDTGRSLFEAGTGLTGIHQLVEGITAEADALFRPAASTKTINRDLKALDDARKVYREATVRPQHFLELQRAYENARQAWTSARQQTAELEQENRRSERILRNAPLVAERATKLAQLAELAQVPPLPEDAMERRVAAQARRSNAEEQQGRATIAIQGIDVEMAGLMLDAPVLQQGVEIVRLSHELDGYLDASRDLPQAKARRDDLERRAVDLVREIAPGTELDAVKSLLPGKAAQAQIAAVGSKYALALQQQEAEQRLATQKKVDLDQAEATRADLPIPRATDPLRAAVDGVLAHGDPVGRAQESCTKADQLQVRVQGELQAIWFGSPEALSALRIPLAATLSQLQEERAALDKARLELDGEEQRLAKDRAQRQLDQRRLAASGEVVTAEHLTTARTERDSGWALIRQGYIDRTGDPAVLAQKYGGRAALPEVYEGLVQEADHTADLLRADATRATEYSGFATRIEEIDRRLDELAAVRNNLTATDLAYRQRWDALLTELGLKDIDLPGLREWLAKRTQVLDRIGQYTDALATQRRDEAALANCRTALAQALTAAGEEGAAAATFSVLLARARIVLQAADDLQEQHKTAQREVERLKAELAGAIAELGVGERRVQTCRANWGAAVAAVRLTEAATAEVAQVRMDQWRELGALLDDLNAAKREVSVGSAAVDTFAARVAALAQALNQTNSPADLPATLVTQWQGRHQAATLAKQAHETLLGRSKEQQSIVETAASDIAAAGRLIDELIRAAGAGAEAELPLVEERAKTKRRLGERVAEIEDLLAQQNPMPLAKVVDEVTGADVDAIGARLPQIEPERRLREGETTTKLEAQLRVKAAFEAVDGGADAAEAMEQVNAIVTRITGDARECAKLRLAAALLNRTIKAYQERNQDPLLRLASERFATLTLGAFSGLHIDYDGEQQVLVGVRPDGGTVFVKGMSEGSTDQLYLALRLAAIERWLADREALPVIVDDLLVQFDNDRAAAALQLLAQLAARTQVLFFTHHQHLLELAKKALPEEAYALTML